jgi:hypothetical protein
MLDFLKRKTDSHLALEFKERFDRVRILKSKRSGYFMIMLRSKSDYVLIFRTNIKELELVGKK